MNYAKVKFANEVILKMIKTSNTLSTMGDQFFKPYNVTVAQYNVLVVLRYTQTYLSQQEIGALLVVSRADVTGIVDRLEKSGFVGRNPHEKDRRIKLVKLTQKGIDLIARVDDAYFQRMEKVTSTFTEYELKQFEKLILKLNIWENGD